MLIAKGHMKSLGKELQFPDMWASTNTQISQVAMICKTIFNGSFTLCCKYVVTWKGKVPRVSVNEFRCLSFWSDRHCSLPPSATERGPSYVSVEVIQGV